MILDRCPHQQRPARFDPLRMRPDKIKLCGPRHDEAKEVAGYLRTSGCTVGCGACCETILLPLDALGGFRVDDWSPPSTKRLTVPTHFPMSHTDEASIVDWEGWLALHDVYLSEQGDGALFAHLPLLSDALAPTSTRWEEWLVWFEKQGISVVMLGRPYMLHVPLRCSALTVSGLCRLYGNPDRPALCGRYPSHPLDIDGLDFCTYNFHRIGRVRRAANLGGRPKHGGS